MPEAKSRTSAARLQRKLPLGLPGHASCRPVAPWGDEGEVVVGRGRADLGLELRRPETSYTGMSYMHYVSGRSVRSAGSCYILGPVQIRFRLQNIFHLQFSSSGLMSSSVLLLMCT